jgi:hypothetical protein
VALSKMGLKYKFGHKFCLEVLILNLIKICVKNTDILKFTLK